MDFAQLREGILACRDCEERFGFEPHPVVLGHQHAKIMQVGQAPSQTVHRTLRPFDDASGRKLKQAWYQISDADFYNPDNFYITSVGHCFPGKAPGGGDRVPPSCCAKKWLVKEVEAVDSRMIILIGGKAAQFFFPGRELTELAFADGTLNGKPVYTLPHPSPLNIKWFKDNPAFERERLPEIRQAVHAVLFGA